MKTSKGLFSVLYFFHACENMERIVSITTLTNQCSSSNRATKHFFYFYLQYFFSFPVDPFPFSLSSHNFRFLVLLLQLFQIGIRLLHVKTIPFLSLYLPNFKFLFFWNQICKSFTYFGSPSIRDTHLISKSASVSHLFKLRNFQLYKNIT